MYYFIFVIFLVFAIQILTARRIKLNKESKEGKR